MFLTHMTRNGCCSHSRSRVLYHNLQNSIIMMQLWLNFIHVFISAKLIYHFVVENILLTFNKFNIYMKDQETQDQKLQHYHNVIVTIWVHSDLWPNMLVQFKGDCEWHRETGNSDTSQKVESEIYPSVTVHHSST